jgi:sugar lactone lactonase YvrE
MARRQKTADNSLTSQPLTTNNKTPPAFYDQSPRELFQFDALATLKDYMKTKPFNSVLSIAPFFVLFLAAATTNLCADIVYVANWNNSTIDRFDSGSGANLGILGSPPGPRGIAIDHAGNIYVASYSDQEILKYTPGGAASVFANINFSHGEGLAFDSSGNLYMSDYVANTITKFAPNGSSSVFASTSLNQPYGMAFDSAGNLYVANAGINTIEKFTPNGVGSVFATGLSSPMGLAFDHAGNLYAANYGGHNIQRFTPNGGVGSVFATGLTDPVGVAFDSAGNLYVADEWSMPNYGSVVKITPNGVSSLFASTPYSGPVFLAILQVPEPSSAALLSLAIFASFAFQRRTQRRDSAYCPP